MSYVCGGGSGQSFVSETSVGIAGHERSQRLNFKNATANKQTNKQTNKQMNQA
jgi:hypothetical protein